MESGMKEEDKGVLGRKRHGMLQTRSIKGRCIHP